MRVIASFFCFLSIFFTNANASVHDFDPNKKITQSNSNPWVGGLAAFEKQVEFELYEIMKMEQGVCPLGRFTHIKIFCEDVIEYIKTQNLNPRIQSLLERINELADRASVLELRSCLTTPAITRQHVFNKIARALDWVEIQFQSLELTKSDMDVFSFWIINQIEKSIALLDARTFSQKTFPYHDALSYLLQLSFEKREKLNDYFIASLIINSLYPLVERWALNLEVSSFQEQLQAVNKNEDDISTVGHFTGLLGSLALDNPETARFEKIKFHRDLEMFGNLLIEKYSDFSGLVSFALNQNDKLLGAQASALFQMLNSLSDKKNSLTKNRVKVGFRFSHEKLKNNIQTFSELLSEAQIKLNEFRDGKNRVNQSAIAVLMNSISSNQCSYERQDKELEIQRIKSDIISLYSEIHQNELNFDMNYQQLKNTLNSPQWKNTISTGRKLKYQKTFQADPTKPIQPWNSDIQARALLIDNAPLKMTAKKGDILSVQVTGKWKAIGLILQKLKNNNHFNGLSRSDLERIEFGPEGFPFHLSVDQNLAFLAEFGDQARVSQEDQTSSVSSRSQSEQTAYQTTIGSSKRNSTVNYSTKDNTSYSDSFTSSKFTASGGFGFSSGPGFGPNFNIGMSSETGTTHGSRVSQSQGTTSSQDTSQYSDSSKANSRVTSAGTTDSISSTETSSQSIFASKSQQTRASVGQGTQIATGFFLKEAPFPQLPIGSLVMVAMPPGETHISRARSIQIVHQTTFQIVDSDVDIYFAVNDAQTSVSNPLTVQVELFSSPDDSVVQASQDLLDEIQSFFENCTDQFIKRRQVTPQEFSSIRHKIFSNIAFHDWRSVPVVGELFTAWVEKELTHLEYRTRIAAFEYEAEILQRKINENNCLEVTYQHLSQLKDIQLLSDIEYHTNAHLKEALFNVLKYQNEIIIPSLSILNSEGLSHFVKHTASLYQPINLNDTIEGLADKVLALSRRLSSHVKLYPDFVDLETANRTIGLIFEKKYQEDKFLGPNWVKAPQYLSEQLWTSIENAIMGSSQSHFEVTISPELLNQINHISGLKQSVVDGLGIGLLGSEYDSRYSGVFNTECPVVNVKKGPIFSVFNGKESCFEYSRSTSDPQCSCQLPLLIGQDNSIKEPIFVAAGESFQRGDTPYTTYKFDFSILGKQSPVVISSFRTAGAIVLYFRLKGLW